MAEIWLYLQNKSENPTKTRSMPDKFNMTQQKHINTKSVEI